MGWKLKALVLLFGTFALAAGAFILAIPAFLWVLWPRNRGAKNRTGPPNGKVSPARNLSWLKYVGIFFLLLAAVALVGGGKLSPFVFGALGAGILLYGQRGGGGLAPWLEAVDNTILLRSRLLPFSWVSVAEVKASSMDPAKLIPLLNDRVLVKVGPNAAAYVVLHVSALREGEAEAKAVVRMRELSRLVVSVGAYVLPLLGEEAASVVKKQSRKLKLDLSDLEHSLASVPYDLVSIKPKGHLVEAIGAYQVLEEGKTRSVVGTPQAVKTPVLVWEAATSIGTRANWATPDDVTTFLSSLAATRGVSVGQRLVEEGPASRPKSIIVKSLSTPAVELGRAQLRALVRVYS